MGWIVMQACEYVYTRVETAACVHAYMLTGTDGLRHMTRRTCTGIRMQLRMHMHSCPPRTLPMSMCLSLQLLHRSVLLHIIMMLTFLLDSTIAVSRHCRSSSRSRRSRSSSSRSSSSRSCRRRSHSHSRSRGRSSSGSRRRRRRLAVVVFGVLVVVAVVVLVVVLVVVAAAGVGLEARTRSSE